MLQAMNYSNDIFVCRDLVAAIVNDDLISLEKAAPNKCDKKDIAGALCAAVLLQRYRCINVLISHPRADPLLPYANRNSVYWAVSRQDLVALEMLVKSTTGLQTVNSARGDDLQRMWYEQRRTVDEALYVAAWLGSVQSVRFLLKHGANPNTCYFYNEEFLLQCSPLTVACLAPTSRQAADDAIQNAEAIVTLLIDAGADVHRRCTTGRTPLHWAVAANLEHAVMRLIAAGADIDAKTAGSKQTPLMIAVTFDSVAIVDTLTVCGSCVDDVDGADCTALCYAVDKRNLCMAERLLVGGASPDGAHFRNPQTTPLIMALSSGDRGMIMLLLRWGADVNRNSRKMNPFATAIRVNNFANARLLLKCGADIRQASDRVSDEIRQVLSKAGGVPEMLRLPDKLRLQELRQLEDEMMQPRLLMEYCRLVVRQTVKYPNPTNLQKLPLPSSLVNYLKYEELG
jgi:ankyrin repeat protein